MMQVSREGYVDKNEEKLTTVKGSANTGHCYGFKQTRSMRKFYRFIDSTVKKEIFQKVLSSWVFVRIPWANRCEAHTGVSNNRTSIRRLLSSAATLQLCITHDESPFLCEPVSLTRICAPCGANYFIYIFLFRHKIRRLTRWIAQIVRVLSATW